MSRDTSTVSPTQLRAYLAFTEVSNLLRHAVEKQLRDAGEL
ncbi:MarR family transcriptional regulator, partial [Microbacterium sp. SUBG005]